MKLIVIAVCRNEEKILPWFLRYYDRLADEIHIHDNSSTDRSREIIQSHPKTKLLTYDTGGKIDDGLHCRIKNEYYKGLDGDWYIIVDMDEFVWVNDLRGFLDHSLSIGINAPSTIGWEMVGDGWPSDDGKSQLTDHVKFGISDLSYSKYAVVHKSIAEINYLPGAHYCIPVNAFTNEHDRRIKILHYKYVDVDTRLAKVRHNLANLSDYNRKEIGDIPTVEAERAYYEERVRTRIQIIE